MQQKDLTPGEKSQYTAKWARTMTKWLITYTRRKGVRWNIVEFGGVTGSESRGIVDLLAIRKDHRTHVPGLKRGDLFDMVLIQTKGGAARRPTKEDKARLLNAAKHHKARAVVLAEWQKGGKPNFYRLEDNDWIPVTPADIFG
jgi:hypothetical protein